MCIILLKHTITLFYLNLAIILEVDVTNLICEKQNINKALNLHLSYRAVGRDTGWEPWFLLDSRICILNYSESGETPRAPHENQKPSWTSIRKAGLGAGEIVQLGKCLTLEGQDLSSIPSIHIKSQMCLYIQCWEVEAGRALGFVGQPSLPSW